MKVAKSTVCMIAIAGLALIATLCVVELNVEETTHLSESVAKWNNCAIEGKSCDFQGVKLVRYGNEGKWIEQRHTNSVACTNAVFSDPDIGKQKQCQWKTDEGSARQVGNQVAEHVKDAETAARKTEEKERTEEDAQLMKNFKKHRADAPGTSFGTVYGRNCLTLKAYSQNAYDDLWDMTASMSGDPIQVLNPIVMAFGAPKEKKIDNTQEACIAMLEKLLTQEETAPGMQAESSINTSMIKFIRENMKKDGGIVVATHSGSHVLIAADRVAWSGHPEVFKKLSVSYVDLLTTAREMANSDELKHMKLDHQKAESTNSMSKEDAQKLKKWNGNLMQVAPKSLYDQTTAMYHQMVDEPKSLYEQQSDLYDDMALAQSPSEITQALSKTDKKEAKQVGETVSRETEAADKASASDILGKPNGANIESVAALEAKAREAEAKQALKEYESDNDAPGMTQYGKNCLTLKAYAQNAYDDLWDMNDAMPGDHAATEILNPILMAFGGPEVEDKLNTQNECTAKLDKIFAILGSDSALKDNASIGRLMLKAIEHTMKDGKGIVVIKQGHLTTEAVIGADKVGWSGKPEVFEQLAVPLTKLQRTAKKMAASTHSGDAVDAAAAAAKKAAKFTDTQAKDLKAWHGDATR